MPGAPRKLPLLLLSGFAVLCSLLPFNRLEWWLQDHLASAMANTPSEEIVIVAIDEKSLSRLGRWPWPRELLAESITKLQGARQLGVNLVLAEASTSPQSDITLAQAIRTHGKVYLPAIAENNNGQLQETLPLPQFARAAKGVGIIDYPADPDGQIRRTYLASGIGSAHLPAFAALLSGNTPKTDSLVSNLRTAEWVNRDERILPHLLGSTGYPTISIVDVLDSSGPVSAVQGKTVIIGVTTGGLGDRYQTPILGNDNSVNGVSIQAATAQAIQQNSTLQKVSTPITAAIIFLLATAWEILGLRRPRKRQMLAALAVSAALIAGMMALQYLWHYYLPLASLALLIPLSSVLNQLLQHNHFKRLAFTDKLTGLANRHQFDDRFLLALQECRHNELPLSLLLVDVDHFKRFNDHYGHAAGDDALRTLASVMQKVCRHDSLLPARIGGEEFAILAARHDETQAERLAAELRHELLSLQLPHEKSPLGRVSVSIGITSQIPDKQSSARALYEEADRALYSAKKSGRDNAVLANRLNEDTSPAG